MLTGAIPDNQILNLEILWVGSLSAAGSGFTMCYDLNTQTNKSLATVHSRCQFA